MAAVIIAVVVSLVGLGLLASVQRGGGGSDESVDAVGYKDAERTVDTSPFQPAEPRSHGSTTLPNGLFEEDATTTTTPPTSTTVPVTTPPTVTTPPRPIDQLPTTLTINHPKPGLGACGLYTMVQSFGAMAELDRSGFRSRMSGPDGVGVQIRGALDEFLVAAPEDVRPSVQIIHDTLENIIVLLEQHDYDTSDPVVAKAMSDPAVGQGPFAEFRSAITKLYEYEYASCP